MTYDTDVFISYAHIDNVPLKKDESGWITIFHRALESRLTQLMGEKPKIWRDPKLQGNDEFAEEIVSKLHKAKILLAIISPRYLKSQWCMKELQGFIKAAESSGGLHDDNKSRIFKIVKTYVPYEEHPDEIRGLLGFEFFHFDELDEKCRPYEFMPKEGSRYYNEFWEKLDDVAWELHKFIKEIDGPDNLQVNPPEKTIYLAETTSDLINEREKIQRSLKQQGYTIFPDRSLPLLLKDGNVRDTVRDYLKGCKLSIHLIGKQYGLIPEGEERSLIDLQNELAAEQCQNKQLSRLIWLPSDLDKNKIDDRQEEFITALQDHAPQDQETDLLKNITLEDIKTIIQDKLEKINKPSPQPPPPHLTRVYLVCDLEDMKSVKPLDDCLFNSGFEVILPTFEGDAPERSELHKENLSICDAMMIYYNHANEFWLNTKLNDLRKAPGYGRTRPMKDSTIFVTGKKTRHKEQLRTHEAKIIRSFFPHFCEILTPFISRIQE